MSRLFISHSSRNDNWAIALRDWLIAEGWSGPDDIFLDLDPERGIVAGQRWAKAFEEAATRCEAVLFLISKDWLASSWCHDEYQLASRRNKKLFALLIDDVALDQLPGGLTAQWQVVQLKGEPAERFVSVHPLTQVQSPIHIAKVGLARLKSGLQKAGIGPETFELQPDPNGPFGWRAPYRGLEALEPEDAAVFFGRSADIVRGIDALRGLAASKPPRLLVILGASGAGKSSFLRAGLWPRLARDDSQWLPLRAIRAGRGGAIEGQEGLLAALEEVHRRFAMLVGRADLRDRLATPEQFVDLLNELRKAAARRALLTQPPFPLPVLCLDQGEEFFAGDAGSESERLLGLARAAIMADAALLLVTIRSDAYGAMQNAKLLAGIDQVPLSLGPVPLGEIARIIREPSEVLYRKVGPVAPVFEAAVIERLQGEVEGETDALPLLAFVLQRLMREHAGSPRIGLPELERSGGLAEAIESEAEAALTAAGYPPGRAERSDALRRLFVPRLARINRDSKLPQRRIARQSDLPNDLLPLVRALIERRLLVARAGTVEGGATAAPALIEVAHEALLKRWKTLAELLAADRDALLLLDGVQLAAADWSKADAARKTDFLVHRGSRLADALALPARGPDWGRELGPAQDYLAACQKREAAERAEKEAALAREQQRLAEIAEAQTRTARLQRRARYALVGLACVVVLGLAVGIWQKQAIDSGRKDLDRAHADLLPSLATNELLGGHLDAALRFAVHGLALSRKTDIREKSRAQASAVLAAALWRAQWQLLGRGGQVANFARFNTDGSRVVTGYSDGTVQIWTVADADHPFTLPQPKDGSALAADFSPDGSRLATASSDGKARIWDAHSGALLHTLEHRGRVNAVQYSHDGQRLVTASDDKSATIWDVASGRALHVLAHAGAVQVAVFSPDDARVATADTASVRLWDAATGQEIGPPLRAVEFPVKSLSFSPDGTRLLTGVPGPARIWDAVTHKQIGETIHPGERVNSVAFRPDGRQIVTASSATTVGIWDGMSGAPLKTLSGHAGAVNAASFSADGKRVLSVSEDHTLRIWDVASGSAEVLFGHDAPVTAGALSADGKHVVTISNDGTVRLWDDAITQPLATFSADKQRLNSVAFSPDGRRFVTASWDGSARIWRAADGKPIRSLDVAEGPVVSAAYSPDGKRIVTADVDKTVQVFDAKSGKRLATLHGAGAAVDGAVFSPDGKRIASVGDDGTLGLWSGSSSDKAVVLLRGQDALNAVAFSSTGLIAVGSDDQTATVLDLAKNQGKNLPGHSGPVNAVGFDPRGQRLVTASSDKTARIWDIKSGAVLTLKGHESDVYSAAFSPDGRRVVTASNDRTTRIWDAASGRAIAVLHPRDGAVRAAAFSPDGQRVVTVTEDGGGQIWDTRRAILATDDMVKIVCARLLPGLTVLTGDEMLRAGYPAEMPPLDVCAGPGK